MEFKKLKKIKNEVWTKVEINTVAIIIIVLNLIFLPYDAHVIRLVFSFILGIFVCLFIQVLSIIIVALRK